MPCISTHIFKMFNAIHDHIHEHFSPRYTDHWKSDAVLCQPLLTCAMLLYSEPPWSSLCPTWQTDVAQAQFRWGLTWLCPGLSGRPFNSLYPEVILLYQETKYEAIWWGRLLWQCVASVHPTVEFLCLLLWCCIHYSQLSFMCDIRHMSV